MIGEITFDKSSKDMNLFLYSIYIIGQYGDNYGIRRNFNKPCFVELMALFTQSNPYKVSNGKTIEERTLYNKSLYAQYYGFIERKKNEDKQELLFLTNRGKLLFSIIECDELNRTCKLREGTKHIFQDLIWNSIVFDTFGRMNDGAQTSKTDIDAPKVIFRLIFDLGKITNEEFFYVLYSLNCGDSGNLTINKNYDNLLEEIRLNRDNNLYDYSSFFNRHGLKNKVSDSKIIDILSDPQIDILVKKTEKGQLFNYLNDDCSRFKKDKDLFSCWTLPLNLFLHSKVIQNAKAFLKQSILNKSKDEKNSIWLNLNKLNQLDFHNSIIKQVSYANSVKNEKFFIITLCENECVLFNYFGSFYKLLKRKDVYKDPEHGISETKIILSDNSEFYFPANINFINIIIG